ncbi:MAG: hypothetical protein IH987_17885 [Planctomycetes bacterium]|nr:hypothetical protein [Planctomycetota bacterium]
MPDFESPQSSSATNETPIDSRTEFEAERRRLIDNIAFLVVRQHRRRQLDVAEPKRKSADMARS